MSNPYKLQEVLHKHIIPNIPGLQRDRAMICISVFYPTEPGVDDATVLPDGRVIHSSGRGETVTFQQGTPEGGAWRGGLPHNLAHRLHLIADDILERGQSPQHPCLNKNPIPFKRPSCETEAT